MIKNEDRGSWIYTTKERDLTNVSFWFCHRERKQYLGVREARTESDRRRANATTATTKDTEQYSEQPFWSSISGRFGSARADVWNVFCRYVLFCRKEERSFPLFRKSRVSLVRVSEIVEKRKRKKKENVDGKEISITPLNFFFLRKDSIDRNTRFLRLSTWLDYKTKF